jgi:hypothetical protein
VFILLLLILGTILVFTGLFTAGSLFLQAYIYSEPVQGIAWRGPAAGVAVGVILGVWLLLARAAPDGRYQTLLQFSPRSSIKFEDVWITGRDGSKEHYKAVRTGNRTEFQREGRPGTANKMRSRPGSYFVMENGEEVEFKADRDSKGNFTSAENQPLAYRDAKGRIMTENYPGEINTFNWGQLFVNFLLNVLFFAVLVLSLWLLLEFQFWHSLGMALILWGVSILFVLPPLLSYAESLGR